MFNFLCKTLVRCRNGYTVTVQNPSMAVSLFLRLLSSDANPESFTVSYLENKCGLSPESALIASKKVRLKNSHKPDIILSFFEKHGFLKTEVSEMIRKEPTLLLCKVEKTISPRVEFLRSKGASTPDLRRIFAANPWIFKSSLENILIPNFNFLVEVLQSEHEAIGTIKRHPHRLSYSPRTGGMFPNINTLRENRVPAANISHFVRWHWEAIGRYSPVKFRKIVEEAKEMGFDPLKSLFIVAIITLKSMSKSTRDKKVEVYKRWGWSDKDITTAFKKFPLCMALSEDKIMSTMDFYVNKLGLESSVIANRPVLLGLSLKKRLIPRGAVIQFLCSKGLVKLDSRITNILECTEKCFFEKHVNCHKEAAHLVNLYNDKLNEAMNEVGRK